MKRGPHRAPATAWPARIRVVVCCLLLCAAPLAAQQSSPAVARPDSIRPKRGAEFLIPLGSWLLPGLGQYIYRAPGPGLAHTGIWVAGLSLTPNDIADTTDVPRDWRDQLGEFGWQISTSAMWLSSWDAFHRAVPALKAQGKYVFLPEREHVGQLITAPFDFRFLRRWTTWVDLTQTAVVTALILSERERGTRYYGLRGRDAAFAFSLGMNAAVGEEAWFRGYFLPLLHQNMGQRFWLANSAQSLLFMGGHLPGDAGLAAYLTAWAMWEGWLTRRNNWSVRESVFHHFWYDFAVVTAAFLVEEQPVRVALPTIRF